MDRSRKPFTGSRPGARTPRYTIWSCEPRNQLLFGSVPLVSERSDRNPATGTTDHGASALVFHVISRFVRVNQCCDVTEDVHAADCGLERWPGGMLGFSAGYRFQRLAARRDRLRYLAMPPSSS
jgi:hypothetical protein